MTSVGNKRTRRERGSSEDMPPYTGMVVRSSGIIAATITKAEHEDV